MIILADMEIQDILYIRFNFLIEKIEKNSSKICTSCGEEKDIELYGIDKTCRNGIKNICKTCIAKYKQKIKDRANEQRRNVSQERRNERNRLTREWLKSNVEKAILKQCKARSVRKGIEFNIELEDIIIPEYCPLLEEKLEPGTKEDYYFSPSVDRLDSSKGYIKGNIRIISMLANTMKNCATEEQLLKFSKNIIKYLSK